MHKSWLHQVLCCLNLALVVVSDAEQKEGSAFLSKLAYPVYTYLFPLLRRIYRDASFERNSLLFSKSLLLAAMFFLLVRALTYFSPLRSFLLVSAGAVSVAAYPLGFLWFRWQWLRISPSQALWVLLETLSAIVSAILYLYRRWFIPRRLTFVLLAAHFGLWAWVSGNLGVALDIARSPSYPGSWTVMFNALLLAILGFLSSVAWAVYIRSTTKADASAMNRAD